MAISILDILRPFYTTLLVPKQKKQTKNAQPYHTQTDDDQSKTHISNIDTLRRSMVASDSIANSSASTTSTTTSTTRSSPTSLPANNNNKRKMFQRQMTSLGRFAMRSETAANPSNITFFVALAHESGKDLNVHDFQAAWAKRVMERHERFRCQVSSHDDRYFEVDNRSLEQKNISKVKHPKHENNELVEQIKRKGCTQMDVTRNLWEIEISSGPLGSSGAIPSDFILDLDKYERETLAIFRIHHSLCDGVSLAVATGDVTDEAALLRARIHDEFRKRTASHSEAGKEMYFFLLAIVKSCCAMLWLIITGVYSLSLQLSRMATSSSPFEPILSNSMEAEGQRTVAWRTVASMEEMKFVGKSISSKTTINDIGVAMVSHAIKCQLNDHATALKLGQGISIRIPKKVNITVPVHLTGGILRPGDQLGNKIGGFVSSIPIPTGNQSPEDPSGTTCTSSGTRERLHVISKVLQREKKLPSPLISWHLAKLFTQFTPQWCTCWALKAFSANSVAVVSNVKGFPFGVHWLGRPVQFLCAFLPLPPGVPIGVTIQSYDGIISFGLHCDKRAVPNAEKFADWMLEEYTRMKEE